LLPYPVPRRHIRNVSVTLSLMISHQDRRELKSTPNRPRQKDHSDAHGAATQTT
jgi:hypothetical protein